MTCRDREKAMIPNEEEMMTPRLMMPRLMKPKKEQKAS
jgi:hypothetical protein